MLRDFHRGRRLRQSPELRALVRDTPPLLAEDLIMPYFVVETDDSHFRKEITPCPASISFRWTNWKNRWKRPWTWA